MITFDNSASLRQNSSYTLTISYTIGSGSNRLLIVYVFSPTNDVTGATYNGTPMLGGSGSLYYSITTGYYSYIFYQYNSSLPSAGTYNVVVSKSTNSTWLEGISASYSGVSQSGFPDNISSQKITASSWNPSITTVANNAWVGVFAGPSSVSSYGSSGGSLRQNLSTGSGDSIYVDSNLAITPAGSYNGITITQSGSGIIGGFIFSLAPSGSGGSNGFFQFF